MNGDEVVVVEDFAKENDLQVGKFMEIVAGTGIEKLRVVGLIAKEGAGQLNNGSFGILPVETAQRLFYRDGELDQIDLVVEKEMTGGQELETLRKETPGLPGTQVLRGLSSISRPTHDRYAQQLPDWLELLERDGVICGRVLDL